MLCASLCITVMFSTHPQPIEARIGDTVNFTCDITGDPHLSRSFIQYQINGTVAIEITANEQSTLSRYIHDTPVMWGALYSF